MSAPDEAAVAEPVTRKQALVDWVAAGCKPPEDWRIGTEHEKFVFHRGDLSPVPYQGERGIGQFLARLQRFGWAPVHEGEHIIALKKDKGSITLEPGGQLELSGAPWRISISPAARCRSTCARWTRWRGSWIWA